jgi:hypothetical protein
MGMRSRTILISHIPCLARESQKRNVSGTVRIHLPTKPTNVKVVGTFHGTSTKNLGKGSTANGTAERACYFCRLCPIRMSCTKSVA